MWFCHVICSQERGQVKNPSATRRAQMWTFPQTMVPLPPLPEHYPFCCSQLPIPAAGNPSGLAWALGESKAPEGPTGRRRTHDL